MADFYPVLARAIATLPSNTVEARRSIYERARAALVAQLRTIQPALSEEQIAAQAAALNDAARRIEAEHAVPPAPEPPTFEPPKVEPARAEPARAEPAKVEPAKVEPPRSFAPSDVRPVAEPAPIPRAEPETKPEPTHEPTYEPRSEHAYEPEPEPAVEQAKPAVAEPAILPPRPRIALPGRDPDRAGRKRTIFVGAGVALAVLGIAIAAYVVNSAPPQPARPGIAGVTPRADADGNAKMGDRVGVDAPAQPGTPSQPALPVAQRAVLYIETPDNPQQPRTIGGRVAWRLDSESSGAGRPVDTVARATVELPEIGLSMAFTIRRNTDAALPASHIIGLRFSRTSDDGNGVVKEAGVPQFKTDEGERGAPLSAISSALGDNLFVVALSNASVEIERNVDLMTRRNWIDIPVRFASGRRGIIAFEKGFSGDQTITDAFNRWR
jgi:hypothetical protein